MPAPANFRIAVTSRASLATPLQGKNPTQTVNSGINTQFFSSPPPAPPVLRDHAQSMGLWLNETIIGQPQKLAAAVRDLAASGYGIIRVMLRNTNFNHRSPQAVEAVAQIVKTAHTLGVKVVLDCEPHPEPVARDMGNLFPDAIGARVARVEAKLVRGRFVAHLPLPSSICAPRTDFCGIHAVFLRNGDGIQKLDTPPRMEHRVVHEAYENEFTTAVHSYQEERPGKHRHYLHLSGELAAEGSLVIYARFRDPGVLDFWSENFTAYYDRLLECYRHIPLDGVAWDEPGIGGEWTNYLSGHAFEAAFARINGYHLADHWAALDTPNDAPDAQSLRVRLDYYRTLNEGIFQAQRRLFDKAREIFPNPRNLILGTHHTWQGEGGINDYRAGAVDYFRLNENMDAGYTDCCWWDYKSVCYAYTLASSLGRLTPSGQAEVNTWDNKPSNARVEFQARLMTLMRLIWFNIWYGEATDTCLYPADRTWPATVREMNRHRDNLLHLRDARPVTEIAILHGWETVCGVNRADIAAAHKTFCLNTAELLLERSVAFDWIDTSLLAASRIEDAENAENAGSVKLVNALGHYTILILPYASVLPREAWETCRQFADAGGRIVFTGTPPDMDTGGASLREEFAQMLSMPVLPLKEFLAGVDAICTLPQYRSERLDVCLDLEQEQGGGEGASRLLVSIENERHGIRNEAGNVIYLSDLDPRRRLLSVINPWIQTEVTCHSDSILWRLYRDDETNRELLICIAREEHSLSGLVRWGEKAGRGGRGGREVEFRSGTLAMIEMASGTLSVIGGNAEYEISERAKADDRKRMGQAHVVTNH